MTVDFLVTTLIVVVTPGTGAIYTIATGLSRGTRASLVAAVGCTLGIVPHVVAAVAGLAAVMQASAVLFDTFKVLGVAYLIYLGWLTWRDESALPTDARESVAAKPARAVIRDAILINLLNPKLTLFFFAFLPQFVPPGDAAIPRMLGLSGVFMLVTLAVFAVYGTIAGVTRERVLATPRLLVGIRRVFAVAFVALAGRLAVAER